MSAQEDMIFSWDEALAADIKALGGRKKVAPRLWPGEDEETANERLKAALSPGHRQQLKPTEVLKIKKWAREVGSDALVRFEDQELGRRGEWLDPENEAEQIRRELRDEFRALNQKMDRLARAEERAAQSAELRAVAGGGRR